MQRTALAVVLALLVVTAGAQDIEHLIPPGYVPEEAKDEQGLWLELEEYERELNKSALLVRDAEIVNYLNGIVCRVAGDYCDDFRVYIVRNPGFNASMTATGMMQIWTGMIVRATSTDELAAVIGHEIAHYTRLHSLERLRSLKAKMATASFFDLGLAVLTGVSAPVGQAAAILSFLSFNREQETEADLLGTKLLADAAYDPHAAYRVWHRLLDEEAAAEVKREKPGLFSQTHPNSEERADYLEEFVRSRYGEPHAGDTADPALLAILNRHYLLLMEDQLDTNRFGRTQELLQRHVQIGVEPALVNFFYGEMYRQRGRDGDIELAIEAYTSAVSSPNTPPEAHKNLGYLYLKKKDVANAQAQFRRYLEARPDASDRAMIEFYLEEDAR